MRRNLQAHLDSKSVVERVRKEMDAADGFVRKLLAILVGSFVTIPMVATTEIQVATLNKLHELVVRNDAIQHPRRPWIGAAFLLVGTIFSFTGQLSGIK